MSKKIGSLTLGSCLAVAMVVGTPRSVPAGNGCSNATLRGSYAVHATGNLLSGPQTGPIAFVGAFTYDGFGQLAGTLTIRTNSPSGATTASRVAYTGTYSVNADCSFEETWTNLSNGTSSIHDGEIFDHSRGFLFVNITAGQPTVVSGVGHKKFSGRRDVD